LAPTSKKPGESGKVQKIARDSGVSENRRRKGRVWGLQPLKKPPAGPGAKEIFRAEPKTMENYIV